VFVVQTLNVPPVAEDGVATIDEDDAAGVWIQLNASDDGVAFGLSLVVTQLPVRGDLFVQDASRPQGLRRIDEAFNGFAVDGSARGQYASSVRASSFLQISQYSLQ
jgi:hypothetical protein